MRISNVLVLTHHARKRIQQRGIPQAAIQTIFTFGTPHHAGKGCVAYHIDTKAIQKAKHDGHDLTELKNTACIVAENRVVVTVEHATRKPRKWSNGNGGRS